MTCIHLEIAQGYLSLGERLVESAKLELARLLQNDKALERDVAYLVWLEINQREANTLQLDNLQRSLALKLATDLRLEIFLRLWIQGDCHVLHLCRDVPHLIVM